MEEKKRQIVLALALVMLVVSVINAITMITLTGRAVSTITGTVSLCINRPHTIEDITDQTTAHNTLFTLQVNASDPDDNNSLVYSDNTSLFEINTSSGLINFTPIVDEVGNYTINITVIDTVTGCSYNFSKSFLLEINNTFPTITAVTDQRAPHSSAFTLQIDANDDDSDNLTYYDNSSLFDINSSSGLINFTPTIDQLGNYTNINITITDNAPGTINASLTFALEIYNEPPNLTQQIPNQTWEEDVRLTGLDLDNYFTDPESQTLNYSVVYGSNINVTIDDDGVVTFRPDTDWNGTTWALFTANDTINTTDSNNVTLNVTDVADFCGDGICNADESCSDCTDDCGTCPAGTTTTTGGGGGGVLVTEKIIREPTEAVCELQTECTDWTPTSCERTSKQARSCTNVGINCGVTETTAERDCICQPQWECTIWIPENCINGTQERLCLDLNRCGVERELPTKQACTPTAMLEKPGEARALAGGAAFQEIFNMIASYSKITKGLLVLGTITMLTIIAGSLITIKRRKEAAALKEYIGKCREIGATDQQIKERLKEFGWKEKRLSKHLIEQQKEKQIEKQAEKQEK